MDLEMISAISNEAVPAPEVEQPKKRKGWTLFRNKKQKTEENVKKATKNKKNENLMDAVTDVVVEEGDAKLTENDKTGHENNEEKTINGDENVQAPINDNDEKLSFGDLPSEKAKKSELLVDETQIGDQTEDAISVKRKRFSLKRFFRRSPKKNEKPSKAVTENLVEEVKAGHEKIQEKGIISDENGKEVPTQEPNNECPANDIKIYNDEKLSLNDAPSEKSEPPIDEIQSGDKPEDDIVSVKRKGFFLKRFFKRSPKKNEKVSKTVPVTENLGEENDLKVTESNEAEHGSEIEKIEEKGINDEENEKEVPTQEPNNECPANDIKIDNEDKLSFGDVPSEKLEPPIDEIQNGDKPEDGTVAEKRKRFTLKMFFRRSPKKNEKVSEVFPATENLVEEGDAKVAEIVVAENEMIEEKGINGDGVRVNIVDHEELPKEDVQATEKLYEEIGAKVAENNVEAGHENIQEKGINDDENGKEVPTQDPINECLANDDKLSVGDVPRAIDTEKLELPIDDNENNAASLLNFGSVNENDNTIEIEQK